MDRTTLTLAVDSSQVGTAAAAFDRFVNAGNAAATSVGRVTAASIAEGRAISQVLVPALNNGINRTRTLEETQAALGRDASRQVSQQASAIRTPAGYAPVSAPAPQSLATGRAVPTASSVPTGGNASLGQLAGGASSAQSAIDRLTAAARNNRSALVQLTPAAEGANRSFRQLSATPIRLEAQQGLSAASAALTNVATQAESARRAIASMSRVPAPAQQPLVSQIAPRQAPANTSAASVIAAAAATARSTTATNAFTAAEGRAAEAALRLAEANARNEAAQARLAVATARAAAAQTAFDNASRSSSSTTEAIASAQTRLQSAQAAVSTASAAATRSQRGATEAADRHRTALNSLGRQSTLTAHQAQQLSFQLNDFFVQVASGGSPLTALIQQGSQLSGTFGGAGGAFRAVLSAITPARVAFGGAATAVGALAAAYYEGSRQSKAFADAVVLTGNYAGQTEGKINALTREIASHGQVTASAVREAAQAALSTGQIGPQVFGQATEAIALYAQATGRTADEVIKDFAEMARSPSKWAAEHNRTLNFVTAKQIDLAEDFEKAGDAAKAQGIIITALIDRLHQLDPNLGSIERTLRSVKNEWSKFWDAAYDVGRTETIEGKIAGLDAKIRESRSGSNPFAPAAKSRTAQLAGKDPKSLEFELQDALAGQAVVEANAFNKAADAEAQQAGISAKAIVDGYLKRGKAASVYKEKLDELNRSFKAREAAGTPVSTSDQQIARAELKKEFAGPKNGEASQVLRAQMQKDLKGIQDVFEKQRDAFQFQNAFVEAAYRNGNVSLTTLMQQRKESIENTAQAQIDELDKERTRLQEYLKQEKDPSTRVQTQTRIDEIGVERDKVETRKSNDIELLNQEKTASFKTLSEQVANYRANLLQMQGDEAGAAALRAQVAVDNAKVLATQAGKVPGAGKVDVDGYERAIAIADRYNEIQRQTSLLASNGTRAEEAYLAAAEQSGKSLIETEQGLYELRSKELTQLGNLAQKAQELAEESKNPALKAFAADIALSYARAAKAIDPALNRLREANRELATSLAQTVGNAPNAFVEFYNQRRSQSEQDIKAQKDEYDKRIDQLRGYLAQEKDERNKASLRKRIDQLQGESDGLKGESKGKTALNALSKTVLEPAAAQVSASISKVLIQDPLQEYFKTKLTNMTEGDGPLAGIFKGALGIKADPKQTALLQQAAALDASAKAADALATAAQNAANALNKPLVGSSTPQGQGALSDSLDRSGVNQSGVDGTRPPPIDSSLEGAPLEASKALSAFGQQTTVTAADVVKLATAAGAGGDAMVRLPGIVGLFQSAVMAMQANSAAGGSGGGLFGAIAGLFGASGTAAEYEAAAAATGIFHSGGIVGQPPATRNTPMSLFAGAPRYHTGGLVGRAADKMSDHLKHNEVPAILMGGPKGKREEVLRADDPRHRDNLGMSIVARIMAESKAPRSSAAEVAREAMDRDSRSSTSALIQSISGSKDGGQSSANVLAGVLDRLGVKDGEESAAASAIRVRGARELGGPVSAGGMYRVNERGPELLEVAGKQYLMMGSQGGSVEPKKIGSDQESKQTIVNVHVTPPADGSRRSAGQWGAEAGRHIQRSLRRNT
jgi:phage-related minor tail protein